MSSLSNVDLLHALGRDLVIFPVRDQSVTPVGYDLRIGLAVTLSEPVKVPPHDHEFLIPASTSALIISKESVWLSGKILATLHSRGSFSAHGLIINSTTVDPNWSGQMTFLVHNSSTQDFKVQKDDPFITMVLHYVRTPTTDQPIGNPISVVKRYGALYGSEVGNAVNTYLNSPENLKDRRAYHSLVREATTPTFWKYIKAHIGRVVLAAKGFRGVCLFLLWMLLLGNFSITVFWEKVSPFVHNIDYDTTVFSGQIGALIAIVFWIIQLSKR